MECYTDIVHCASCNPEPVLPETLLCKAVNELWQTSYKIRKENFLGHARGNTMFEVSAQARP